jgi:hypothetical protein
MTMKNDPLENRFSELRTVHLIGPRLSPNSIEPLWQIWASCPHFMAKNAFDSNAETSGVTVDHIHPMRVLSQLPSEDPLHWAKPTFFDLHLIMGASAKDTPADILKRRGFNYGTQSILLNAAPSPIQFFYDQQHR